VGKGEGQNVTKMWARDVDLFCDVKRTSTASRRDCRQKGNIYGDENHFRLFVDRVRYRWVRHNFRVQDT
jgi:hypothetical protein